MFVAIASDYRDTLDSDEFYDSLYRLSRSWRRSKDMRALAEIKNLLLIDNTNDGKIFRAHDEDVLEALYYLNLPVL